MFAQITEVLGSDGNFGTGNLNHHIDALLIDHPLMGSRVVEFDEEVNFTPPRKFTLQILRDYSEILPTDYRGRCKCAFTTVCPRSFAYAHGRAHAYTRKRLHSRGGSDCRKYPDQGE